MIFFRLYLCLYVLLQTHTLFAQNREECKEKLLKHTKKALEATPSNNFALLEMRIHTYLKNPYTDPITQNLKTISGNGITVYDNGQVSFYQDNNQSFMVVHEAKKIFWTKGGAKVSQTDNPNVSVEQLPNLKLKMIETSEVICLGDTLYNGLNTKMIELKVGIEMQNFVNFRKIKYYMDWENMSVQKQIMVYPPNYQYTKQIIEYTKQDANYKGNVHSNVKYYIFDTNNSILTHYKNYTLEKIGF